MFREKTKQKEKPIWFRTSSFGETRYQTHSLPFLLTIRTDNKGQILSTIPVRIIALVPYYLGTMSYIDSYVNQVIDKFK